MKNPTILCIDTITRIMSYELPYTPDAWEDMLLYPAIENTVHWNHETLQALIDNYKRMYANDLSIRHCQAVLDEWRETMRQHMED